MSDTTPLTLVILAAGKGTRMKSHTAKVLHECFYAPMLHHVLHATKVLKADKTIVVVGHQRQKVIEGLNSFSIEWVNQDKQLGTGHAVLCAKGAIRDLQGNVMILCGDTPLVRPETLHDMMRQHRSGDAPLTVMTTMLNNPRHYGRIISSPEGHVQEIVEEKDATPEQQKINEVNAGIYCIETQFLFQNLGRLGTDNSQGEVYLTDIVSQAASQGLTVQKFVNPASQDVLGVNSRKELALAHQQLQMRRNHDLMAAGITMIHPESIQVSPGSSLATDVCLHPGVEISGTSSIGMGCDIQAGALLHNVHLGEYCRIGAYSTLEDCSLDDNSILAPHSHHC